LEPKKKYEIVQPLIIGSMLAIGMFFGYLMADKEAGTKLIGFSQNSKSQNISSVQELYQLMDEKYLYSPDFNAMDEDAIQHIFSNMDPYSIYIPEKELESVNNSLEGTYKGLGIEMLNIRDTLVITGILPGSPAKKIGLRKLDRIISLDKKPLVGKKLNLQHFRKEVMKGQKRKMELGIYRKANKKKLTFSFVPQEVETPSISYYSKWQDSVLYIRLDQFHAKTYQEFMLVVEKNQKEEYIPALILDVRDNPGGYLTEVTKMLSEFFEESDKLLVSTVVKDGRVKEYKSTGRSFYKFGKIIVLTNKNSASGSEVLAGVVQDWDLGLVVGEKSFGKGLVQEQFPLSNGGAVRLTVANYYLPTGRSIQHSMDMNLKIFKSLKDKFNIQDTFVTLRKSRKLTVSEGVMPDFVVEDELFENLIRLRYNGQYSFDKEIIDLIENYPGILKLTPVIFFNNFSFSPGSIQQLSKFLPENPSVKDKQILGLIVKFRVGQLIFGETKALDFIKDYDPVIQTALKKIAEPKWF